MTNKAVNPVYSASGDIPPKHELSSLLMLKARKDVLVVSKVRQINILSTFKEAAPKVKQSKHCCCSPQTFFISVSQLETRYSISKTSKLYIYIMHNFPFLPRET